MGEGSANPASDAPAQSRVLQAVLVGGLIAGCLDIVAAFVLYSFWGATPVGILQFIVSGVLGRAAFGGGLGSAALGVLLHFCIATGAAAAYVVACRWIEPLVRRPWLFGPLYGVAVFFFMQMVVLPLSAVQKRPFMLVMDGPSIVVHMVCVGTPIALVASRHIGGMRGESGGRRPTTR